VWEDFWTPLTGGIAIKHLVPMGLKPATRRRAADQGAEVLRALRLFGWFQASMAATGMPAGTEELPSSHHDCPCTCWGCSHSCDANSDERARGKELGAEFLPKNSCPSPQPLVSGPGETVPISIPYLALAQAFPTLLGPRYTLSAEE